MSAEHRDAIAHYAASKLSDSTLQRLDTHAAGVRALALIFRTLEPPTRAAGASSARFAQADLPGASLAGNPDLRGISLANYYTSPVTRAMVDTGMNYGTFSYLRNQGFSRGNIASAAHDAKALGFSANDQRMVKNHAVIRQRGNDPDKTNELFAKFQKVLRGDKEFQDAALAWHKAKPEDKAAAWKRIQELSAQQSKKAHIPEHMAKERDQAVRKAIGEITKEITNNEVQEAFERRPGEDHTLALIHPAKTMRKPAIDIQREGGVLRLPDRFRLERHGVLHQAVKELLGQTNVARPQRALAVLIGMPSARASCGRRTAPASAYGIGPCSRRRHRC